VTIKVIPPAPVAIAAGNITQTSFSANWNASPGATGYYLDVSTKSSFTSFLKNYKNKKISNVTTAAVSGLTANTMYYYRVRAFNSIGTSPNSNTISLTTSSAGGTGYKNNNTGNSVFEVKMYPNPTRGPVTFEINKSFENIAVSVYSIYGTEVFHKEYPAPGRISIDLSLNSAGLYFVKLKSGDTEIVKKLILDK
jgi:hypothetical protein